MIALILVIAFAALSASAVYLYVLNRLIRRALLDVSRSMERYRLKLDSMIDDLTFEYREAIRELTLKETSPPRELGHFSLDDEEDATY